MDRRPLVAVCVAVVAAAACLYGADDDLAYAGSLEEAGYCWAAIGEYKAIRDSLGPEQQILLHYRLGGLYTRCGDTQAAEAEYDRFLAAAAPYDTPRLRQAVEAVTRARAEDAEAAGFNLVRETVRNGIPAYPAEVPATLKNRVAMLEQYRLAHLAAYERLRDRSAGHEREYRSRLFAAGKARVLAGIIDRTAGGTWHREALAAVYDECCKPLQAYEAEMGPEAPFLRGLVLEGLDRPAEAARAYLDCAQAEPRPASAAMRREGYFGAVRNFNRVAAHMECAQAGIGYFMDFQGQLDPASPGESTLRRQLVSSLDLLNDEGNPYLARVERRGGSYAVLAVRATHTAASPIPARTYTIIGAAANVTSSAVIELPGMAVQTVNTTVAVPSN